MANMADVKGGRAGDFSVYVRLALVAVAWGGTFIAGRSLACLRFVLASAALSLFLLLSGKGFRRVNGQQALVVTLLGFCGIFSYSFFFFSGLQHISASRAALIVALNPAVMTLIAYLFYREQITVLKVLGIVLCFCGVALVVGGGDPQGPAGRPAGGLPGGGGWLGEALIGGCVLSWSAYSVFCKSVVRQLGPLHTVTYSIYAGTLMLLLYASATGVLDVTAVWRFSPAEIASLLYLGVVGSAVAYIWYYDGIQQIGVARASVFIALNPLSAVLFGAALLGEQMTLATLLGGVLIISGIVVENRQSAAAATPQEQPAQSRG